MSEEIITETNRETATDHEYGGAQILHRLPHSLHD